MQLNRNPTASFRNVTVVGELFNSEVMLDDALGLEKPGGVLKTCHYDFIQH